MAEFLAHFTDGSVLPAEGILVSDDRDGLHLSTIHAVTDRGFRTGIMVVSLPSGNILYVNRTATNIFMDQGDTAPPCSPFLSSSAE